MMNQALTLLQESVKKRSGEWLWTHNRWKQQTPKIVYKRFRHDCICIILPTEKEKIQDLLLPLATLQSIYATNFLFFLAPTHALPFLSFGEVIPYQHIQETLRDDPRFKLIFNFTDYKPIHTHYQKLSAFEVLDIPALQTIAAPHLPPHLQGDLSEVLKRALCRPGTIWQPETPHAQ